MTNQQNSLLKSKVQRKEDQEKPQTEKFKREL